MTAHDRLIPVGHNLKRVQRGLLINSIIRYFNHSDKIRATVHLNSDINLSHLECVSDTCYFTKIDLHKELK